MNATPNRRILLVDDMPRIHEDFRKILGGLGAVSDLGDEEALLFGESPPAPAPGYVLESAYQGLEAIHKVTQAEKAGLPYAMAFVDMRMPPGLDGVETVERLWQVAPGLQIVLCTAYSDYSWDQVLDRLDARDRLLVLKKPFDNIEVRQLANTLVAKWELTRQADLQLGILEDAVRQRTTELTLINRTLQAEIIERRQLEDQLVQSEKLASIGQLAAGVAHEINNPIGFVQSNLSTLDRYVREVFSVLDCYRGAAAAISDPEVLARIEAAKKCADLEFVESDVVQLLAQSKEGIRRVTNIVRDLKNFSRSATHEAWEWADLHDGIESALNMLANEIKYKAEVRKEYGELPEVQCRPSQLNQVFMNILVNGAHAMTEHGILGISTGVQGDRVWVAFSDTGSGIKPEHLARIFDPFFTTKPVGKSTGLGLSLTYGIVKDHGGNIEVQSTLGVGTTFRIWLPLKQPVINAPPVPVEAWAV